MCGESLFHSFYHKKIRTGMGELDYSFNLFYLIVNLDCVPNLQTSLWKTTASALSMSLMAVILTFAELILPKNKSTSCKME